MDTLIGILKFEKGQDRSVGESLHKNDCSLYNLNQTGGK